MGESYHRAVELRGELDRKRLEIEELEKRLIDVLSLETGIKVGSTVTKDGSEYLVVRLEGESAEMLSIYGAQRKLNGEFASRCKWLGWPRDVKVVRQVSKGESHG